MSGWCWHDGEAKGAGLTLQTAMLADKSWCWSVYEDANGKLVDRAHAPKLARARIACEAAANRYLERL